MPLDPQTRVLLQQMEKANLTPYEAMPLPRQRGAPQPENRVTE